MIHVLFVCMGNICRSPMAEAVFQDMVDKAGLTDQFQIDSAGTGNWYAGQTAHQGTLAVVRRANIAYKGRARQIQSPDFDKFDYIVAMDRENLAGIRRVGTASKGEVNLFLRWAKEAGAVSVDEVPDPYYDNSFDRVYDLVQKGCAALLAHIRAEHNL
jgi:protein-tyrosine phosphatase